MGTDQYDGWTKMQLNSELARLRKVLSLQPLHRPKARGITKARIRLVEKKLRAK